MDNISGIIKNVCLVNFTNVPAKHGLVSIAWGNVVEDFKGRFPSGSWMHTSLVQKIEGDMIHTQNSLYQVEGEMEVISLPIDLLPVIYDGAPPQSVRGLVESGYTFISPFTGEPIILDDVNEN